MRGLEPPIGSLNEVQRPVRREAGYQYETLRDDFRVCRSENYSGFAKAAERVSII